jgi:hypothetical protein
MIRGAPQVRATSPVLARYLDDLAKADRALAGWDNYEALSSAGRLGGAAEAVPPPRSLMEPADYSAAIESMLPQRGVELPLSDQLLRMDRTRTLLDSRLGRLTPEQQASSLPLVGRQYDADRAAARADDIRRGRDADAAMALTAAGGLGAAAFAARVAQERDANRKARDMNIAQGMESAVRDIDIDTGGGVYVPDVYVGASAEDVPDLFADDTYLPLDSGADEIALEDQLADDVASIRVPGSGYYLPRDDESKAMINRLSRKAPVDFYDMEQRSMGAIRKMRQDRRAVGPELFTVDSLMALDPISPEEAAAAAPGPGSQVGRPTDMENLPGPQLRSIKALIGAGIPASRAMDIITKGASMSPDEYRMVTGGRR